MQIGWAAYRVVTVTPNKYAKLCSYILGYRAGTWILYFGVHRDHVTLLSSALDTRWCGRSVVGLGKYQNTGQRFTDTCKTIYKSIVSPSSLRSYLARLCVKCPVQLKIEFILCLSFYGYIAIKSENLLFRSCLGYGILLATLDDVVCRCLFELSLNICLYINIDVE